ncbi:MAG: hypothetical protein ACTSYB_08150, partial [Candidatus Helarchaeota archaeon]
MKIKFIIIIGVVIGASITSGLLIWLKFEDFRKPAYERVLLPQFPVSLYHVFWNDSIATQTTILNNIKTKYTEMTSLFIVPYPNLYHLDHLPAAGKWYVYTNRNLSITIPVDSYMEITQDWAGNLVNIINGTEVQINMRASFRLNYYITLELNHVCINTSLVHVYNNAGTIDVFGEKRKAIFLPANTTIGFSMFQAFDLLIEDRYVQNYEIIQGFGWDHWVNPYYYFTEEVRNELDSYYQMQYNAMAESGG